MSVAAVNDTLRVPPVLLGCGDLIESVVIPPTTSWNNARKNDSPRYVLRVVGTDRTIFETADWKVFVELREPLMEAFQKLFAIISPTKCNMLVRSGYVPHDSFYSLFNEKEVRNLSSAETLVLSYFMSPGEDTGAFITDDERIEIVRSIGEYVESETFDTVGKINKVIKPWFAVIGVENIKLMGEVDMNFAQAKALRADPVLVSMFRKFAEINATSMLDKLDVPLSDIDFKSNVDYGFSRSFNTVPTDFFNLPVDDPKFREIFFSLNVKTAKSLLINPPKNLSVENFLEWMEHEKANEEQEVNDEIDRCEELITRALNSSFGAKTMKSLRKLDSKSIEDAIKSSGYRAVATAFFPNHMGRFHDFTHFSDVQMALIQYFGNNWIMEDKCTDYILLKLFESLGSAEKVVDTIMLVSDSDERFTAAQWLEYLSLADVLNDVPVAWWGAMLGDAGSCS